VYDLYFLHGTGENWMRHRNEIFIPMWVTFVDRFLPQSMAADGKESAG
jgi:hypothetical protein